MLQIVLRTWGLTLLIGALGGLLGFGLELVTGRAGWAVIGVSMGLCAGAGFAGSLMNRGAAAAPAIATSPTATAEPPAAAPEPRAPSTE
jgi:hypothetical protein